MKQICYNCVYGNYLCSSWFCNLKKQQLDDPTGCSDFTTQRIAVEGKEIRSFKNEIGKRHYEKEL